MSLRDEAKAMRLRLAQLEGTTEESTYLSKTPTVTGHPTSISRLSTSVGVEASALTTATTAVTATLDGGTSTTNASRSGKYSRVTLEKKLKKVEKMLDRSASDTKEYKKLQKKWTEYRNQLGQEQEQVEQECKDDTTRIDTKRSKEKPELVNYPNQLCESKESVEILRREDFREEARRLMKKALKKKKEGEIDADGTGSIKEEQTRKLVEERMEEVRYLNEEKRERLKKKQRDIKLTEERRHQELTIRPDETVKEKTVNKESKTEATQTGSIYHNDDKAERKEKKTYLEEARTLKKEAMKKKRKEEKKIEKEEGIRQQRQHNDDDRGEKEAYLVEARRLKQEATEKKRIENEQRYNPLDTIATENRKDEKPNAYTSTMKIPPNNTSGQQKIDFIGGRSKDKELEKREQKQRDAHETRKSENEGTTANDIQDLERNIGEKDQQSLECRTKEEKDERSLHQKSIGSSTKSSMNFLDLTYLHEPYSDNTKKILGDLESNETRRNKIERVLMQNDIPISENIAYEEAKDKIADITVLMKELMAVEKDSYTLEKKYFPLEEQLAKYTTALMLTDEFAEDQVRLEENWEDSIETGNIAALHKLRSHMPVKIRHMTEEELAITTTPNGKNLPKVFARKVKRTNILQLLRVDPDDIEKMHPSLLESMRTTGLTLTERRAIHEHFRDMVDKWAKKRSDPSIEKKWQWYQSLRSKFKEMLNAYSICVEKYGPPGNHLYSKRSDPGGGGCPLLGNQCPLKADANMDYNEDYGYTKEAEYESGSGIMSPRSSSCPQHITSEAKSSETEMIDGFRSRLHLDANETEVDKKVLRALLHSHKRITNLEKQLTLAGLSLPKENISYCVAKTRVSELTEELQKIASSMGNTNDAKELPEQERNFGKLSEELDKYNNALMLTKEWAQEQKDKECQWEIYVSQANYEALQKIWRHMPVHIRNMSETALASYSTPNGKVLPVAIIKKFKRTNILMILRIDPTDIELMHPSSLEAMRTTGLTLTERRALHEHLKGIASKWKEMKNNKLCGRKWMWHASLKSKFKDMLEKYDKHVETYGPSENHPYRKRNDPSGTGCALLGNQCPIKADQTMDYNDDYGFPDHAEYEKQSVAKSNLPTMDELEKRKRENEFY
mmetsp:Transcript_3627/g.4101  ORF Transcript_3627/g.4101 Transcript_3627/m.4101 type:complete len:1130 (+) Transcript_3627:230-3619(+)